MAEDSEMPEVLSNAMAVAFRLICLLFLNEFL